METIKTCDVLLGEEGVWVTALGGLALHVSTSFITNRHDMVKTPDVSRRSAENTVFSVFRMKECCQVACFLPSCFLHRFPTWLIGHVTAGEEWAELIKADGRHTWHTWRCTYTWLICFKSSSALCVSSPRQSAVLQSVVFSHMTFAITYDTKWTLLSNICYTFTRVQLKEVAHWQKKKHKRSQLIPKRRGKIIISFL